MNITIRKIGNSEGIIIPKEMLEQMGLKAGDSVDLRAQDNKIIISAADPTVQRQLEAARIFMEKYKVVLQELAKC